MKEPTNSMSERDVSAPASVIPIATIRDVLADKNDFLQDISHIRHVRTWLKRKALRIV